MNDALTYDLEDPVVDAAMRIARRLQEAGYQALWVGGCVRDLLLGYPPKDIDVATDALPEQVQALFDKTRAVGAQFGVVLVIIDEIATEVATFRTEGDYRDARRPSTVEFATAEEDAHRRDFTFNALYYDPVAGEILDFVDGKQDLTDGILRAIGDPSERFHEDALRLLRAIRFAMRFSFEIEENTWNAIRENVARIALISPERIREELTR
ncbi:MAG: CCA tRNA nucleotidyltransferase, partial [Candidatus Sumerlaeota bacterium]